MKIRAQGARLQLLYEVSIVVQINFIAILLTPGIFLIQIVNTNKTNMYLIHLNTDHLFKKKKTILLATEPDFQKKSN